MSARGRGYVTRALLATLAVWPLADTRAQAPSRAELAQALAAWLAVAPAPSPARVESNDPAAARPTDTLAAPRHTTPANPGGVIAEPFRPSYFDQLQLRTETDRLDANRQRYSLRVEPKLPHLRAAERALQASQRATLETRPAEARHKSAAEALERLFEQASLARELALLDSLLELQARLVRVSRERLAEPAFDVERLLDAEDERADLHTRRGLIVARLAAGPLPPLPLGRLVGPTEVLARAARLAARAPYVQDDARVAAELAVIDAELRLERAENLKVIDFVQADYRSDLEPGRQRYSIGGGVRLPQSTRRNRDIDELRVERAAELQRVALAREAGDRAHAEAYASLLRAADELGAVRATTRERIARRAQLRDVLTTATSTRPDALLRIERRDLLDRREVLERELELVERYAEWVAESVVLDPEALAAWVLTD